MGLRLKIENMANLPDGGPLEMNIPGKRGIDIGREQHLDWTLPDPTRFISGKHCEIRYKEGAYWLHDVSTNGTFLNGAEDRMRSPHRLRTGDRLEIGDYLIGVIVESEPFVDAAVSNVTPPSTRDFWQSKEAAAPAEVIEPKRPRRDLPAATDFLDRLVDTAGPANDSIWNELGRPPAQAKLAEVDWRSETPSKAWEQDGDAALSYDDRGPQVDTKSAQPPLAADLPLPPSMNTYAAEASLPMPAPPPPAAEHTPPPALDFVKLIAKGAGVHESVFANRSPAELAETLGSLLRLTAANLQDLLSARTELKDVVRSSSHTTIVKANNNPLKFSPDVEDALRTMFAPASPSYLDARRTIEQSFNDLKQHQGQIFSAIQGAVGLLQRDLDPKVIEAEAEPDRGLGAIVASRKAKLWDAYVARWRINTARHENGLLGLFFDYFAKSYDRAINDRRFPSG